jgi:hypothetical protein
MHAHGLAKGQRTKGRPLPTSHETCRGVLGMKLIAGLFLLIGFLADNMQVVAISLFVIFIGVLFEK